MITVSATDLLRVVDATLVEKVEPSLSDMNGRAAFATVRHLLNFVLVRIEKEGQALTDEIASTRPLLADIAAYHDGAGDAADAQAVRDALAEVPSADPARYQSLDDLAKETGALREALHRALANLQAKREARGGDEAYRAIRAAIRAQIVRQIETEGEIVGPSFFGRGPRR